MKFVRFVWQGEEALGLVGPTGQFVLSLGAVARAVGRSFPFTDAESYIQHRLPYEAWVEWVHTRYLERGDFEELQVPHAVVKVLSPIRRPVSLRDGYAFRQHVEAARRNRGLEMIPEFD
ncbi:MAG: hypothetical protein N2170_03955, partial [Bacteroidia bacterium]|nr:hypothetical protein [Bacteroidia bacterium]